MERENRFLKNYDPGTLTEAAVVPAVWGWTKALPRMVYECALVNQVLLPFFSALGTATGLAVGADQIVNNHAFPPLGIIEGIGGAFGVACMPTEMGIAIGVILGLASTAVSAGLVVPLVPTDIGISLAKNRYKQRRQ